MTVSLSNAAALEARSLASQRGGRRLFTDLSFELAPGQLLQVVGPNGSGKTTLLRILCGLRTADAGEVRWHGQPIEDAADQYRENLCYIGFQSALKPELTPRENLACAASLARAVRLTAEEAMTRTGLGAYADVACRQLSSGQIRRTALARLLMLDTPLWILDEPLTGLDQSARMDFEHALFAHAEQGGMGVFTTHSPLSGHAGCLRRLELGT